MNTSDTLWPPNPNALFTTAIGSAPRLVSGLGSVVGPLIGAILMAHFEIDGVFYFMSAAALILTFLAAGRSLTTTAPHHLERPLGFPRIGGHLC